MQRPRFSQSPKRVGSGPSRPPISTGGVFEGDAAPTDSVTVWDTAVVVGVDATSDEFSWRLLGMAS